MYRFDNSYGASVVKHRWSYGQREGLWELGVIIWSGDGEDDFSLTYDTPITDDVIGHLNDEQVQAILKKIKALPQVGELFATEVQNVDWSFDRLLESFDSMMDFAAFQSEDQNDE